jgi:hypothetical protein
MNHSPNRCLALALGLGLSFAATAQTAPSQGAVMPPKASAQIDETFAAWDTNHDKVLSLEEFRAGARNTEVALVERRMRAQFNVVDKNHDGFVDAGEYASLLLVKRAGQQAPALPAFDKNKDQKLDFTEYTDLVRTLASRPAPRPAKP